MREIRRDDDGALLGYLRPVGDAWQPLTVFGYPLGEPRPDEKAAEEVHRSGLSVLGEPWLFLQEGRWHRCVILEADEREVRVRPTGHDYPHDVYALTLERPGPDTFRPE